MRPVAGYVCGVMTTVRRSCQSGQGLSVRNDADRKQFFRLYANEYVEYDVPWFNFDLIPAFVRWADINL